MDHAVVRETDDIDILRVFAMELCEEREALQSTNAKQSRSISQLERENEYLHERLRILLHQRYGHKSETLKALQVDLFDSPEALAHIAESQESEHDLEKSLMSKRIKRRAHRDVLDCLYTWNVDNKL